MRIEVSAPVPPALDILNRVGREKVVLVSGPTGWAGSVIARIIAAVGRAPAVASVSA